MEDINHQSTSASVQKKGRRRWLYLGVALLTLISLGYLFRYSLLVAFAKFVIVDQPQQTVDMIYVINGEVETRPFHAAELYLAGVAPKIVIPRAEESPANKAGVMPHTTDVAIQIMEGLGVPSEDIVELRIPGGVTSTFDEAVLLREYTDENNIQTAVLVTSAFHTRRANWIMQRQMVGSSTTLTVSAAPHWGYDETNWWTKEAGLISLTNEYIKMGYYLARY